MSMMPPTIRVWPRWSVGGAFGVVARVQGGAIVSEGMGLRRPAVVLERPQPRIERHGHRAAQVAGDEAGRGGGQHANEIVALALERAGDIGIAAGRSVRGKD